MINNYSLQNTQSNDFTVKIPYKTLNSVTGEDLKMLSIRYINKSTKNILIFDFADVNFIEPTGIAALINVWSRCNRKGIKLLICNLNPLSRELFEKKGIDKLIDIIDTYDQAVFKTKHFSFNVIQLQNKSYQLASVFGEPDQNKLVLT